MTQITENDIMLKNKKNDVSLPKNDTNHRKWRYANKEK